MQVQKKKFNLDDKITSTHRSFEITTFVTPKLLSDDLDVISTRGKFDLTELICTLWNIGFHLAPEYATLFVMRLTLAIQLDE